ncbi:MAG TPA: carbonic anhydrase [Thermoleophilaceae bacterium]|nr:carbonic anhydrase [Thermoleophilaceae bacterium]
MSVTDELLRNNAAYAESFDGAGLPKAPAKQLAVVACMDVRLNPYEVLGIEVGDAHLIRNAGGIVGDEEIRSLAVSQHKLGTREVVLIHHTDCGMLGLDDEEFARELEETAGQRPPWAAGGFPDLEQDVRDSIARIKESPFIPHTESVRGFIYDVETGKLNEVAAR